MHAFLIVLATLIIGVALRSCRTLFLRKLGALTFLFASFLVFFYLCGTWWAGLIGAILWFFLPWIDLLTRIRKIRLPVDNHLSSQTPPSEEHFPNASRLIHEIESADFEYVNDRGWDWAGMHRHYRFFWHPEAKAIASVCLCEHERVAFAYVTISSTAPDGRRIHTTNYPFSPTLKPSPLSHWLYLPCEKNNFAAISQDHQAHLAKRKLALDELLIPDPDEVVAQTEAEMKARLVHNEKHGIITLADPKHFKYSTKGLFFLWFQSVKDMIRLC